MQQPEISIHPLIGRLLKFDRFKAESEDNVFALTPQQRIKATDAIGIVSKPRRYGGTYAHTDIAFEFALYIIWRLKKSIPD